MGAVRRAVVSWLALSVISQGNHTLVRRTNERLLVVQDELFKLRSSAKRRVEALHRLDAGGLAANISGCNVLAHKLEKAIKKLSAATSIMPMSLDERLGEQTEHFRAHVVSGPSALDKHLAKEGSCTVADVLNFCVSKQEQLVDPAYVAQFNSSRDRCFFGSEFAAAAHCPITSADLAYYFSEAQTLTDFRVSKYALLMQCAKCVRMSAPSLALPKLMPFACPESVPMDPNDGLPSKQLACEMECASQVHTQLGGAALSSYLRRDW